MGIKITKNTVSIGLAVYNGEKYIEETILSVLNQSHKDLELIISDNFSDDNTERICRKFASEDERISFYRQTKNEGYLFNYKFVLEKSKSDYYMWLAHDDLLMPNMIQNLLYYLKNNSKIVLISSDIQNIDEFGKPIYVQHLKQIRFKQNLDNNLLNNIKFFRNPTSSIYHSFYGLYRKDKLRGIELNYSNKLKYATGMEIPFLAQVALKGFILSIPLVLKKYRRHSDSMYHKEVNNIDLNFHFSNSINISYILFLILKDSRISLFKKIVIFFVLMMDLGFIYVKNFIKFFFNLIKSKINLNNARKIK